MKERKSHIQVHLVEAFSQDFLVSGLESHLGDLFFSEFGPLNGLMMKTIYKELLNS